MAGQGPQSESDISVSAGTCWGEVVSHMTTDFATRTPAEADWPQNRSSFHERTFGRPPLVEHVETSVVAVEPSALATPTEAGISPPRTSRRRSRLVGMTVTAGRPAARASPTKRGSTRSTNGTVQGTTRSLYSGCRFKNVTTNGQVARTFHVPAARTWSSAPFTNVVPSPRPL